MSEIPDNAENPKTPEDGTQNNSDAPSGELTREEMKAKMKTMSRRIASLKRKSARSKKANKVTPTKLNFDGEGCRKEGGDPEKEANPEGDNGEHSQAASVSVFDRLGRKLIEPLMGANLKDRNTGLLPAKDRRSPCLKLGQRTKTKGRRKSSSFMMMRKAQGQTIMRK